MWLLFQALCNVFSTTIKADVSTDLKRWEKDITWIWLSVRTNKNTISYRPTHIYQITFPLCKHCFYLHRGISVVDVAWTNLSSSVSFPWSSEHFLYYEKITWVTVYRFHSLSYSINPIFPMELVLVKPKCWLCYSFGSCGIAYPCSEWPSSPSVRSGRSVLLYFIK